MLTGRRLLAVMVPLVTAAFLLFFSSSASALAITSTPPTAVVEPNTVFYYNITSDNNWVGNITVTSTLGTKLVLQDWNLSFLPTDDDVGLWYVNITVHDTIATIETYAYQNFTLEVNPVEQLAVSPGVIISLVLGFGMTALAFVREPPVRGIYIFIGGLVWVFSSLVVFPDYGIGWLILFLGLGLFQLSEGALEITEVI